MAVLTLPTYITLARIVLAIAVAAVFAYSTSAGAAWLAAGLFAIASMLDFLDGFLARRLDLVSPLGRMLDPIADKVLVLVVLVAMVSRTEHAAWLLPPVILIIVREVGISGIREFVAGEGTVLSSTLLAKAKTTFQLIAVAALLIAHALHLEQDGAGPGSDLAPAMTGWNGMEVAGTGLLWLAAVLTLASGVGYVRSAVCQLQGKTQK